MADGGARLTDFYTSSQIHMPVVNVALGSNIVSFPVNKVKWTFL